MEMDHFINIPADAIMPPAVNNQEEYEEPYYEEEPEVIEDAEEEQTEEPAEEATEEPTEEETIGETYEATVAVEATAAPVKKDDFSDSLLQALYIVIPVLFVAVVSLIIFLIVSHNKNKKAAANAARNGIGVGPRGADGNYYNNGPDNRNDPPRY